MMMIGCLSDDEQESVAAGGAEFVEASVKVLEISTSKLWKFAHCAQLLLLYYVQPDDGHHKGRNM